MRLQRVRKGAKGSHAVLVPLVLLGLLGGLAAAVTPFARGDADRARLHWRQIASGLSEPVYVAATSAEPSRLYIVERAGRIMVAVNGRLRGAPFLDIRGLVQTGYEEQGLLSMAFQPNYAKNHLFYVYYTNKKGDVTVARYRSNGTSALTATRRQLLLVSHRANTNHDGGQLQFGPDGLLYAGIGDGGSGGDPPNNAQNLSRRLGKLLRLTDSGWHVVAYGLRNPWRFSFDRANGDLYIADVGQDTWEEVDYRSRASTGLVNYGWSAYEGNARFKPARLNHVGQLVFPVTVYNHSQGCSITGGYVYRGRAVPAAQGRYFYGDYCSGRLWSLRVSGGKAVDVRREPATISGLSSFGEDSRGELYAVSLGGRIYKLTG